jgi:ABC-type bacteriocin/lantibiotic exporter with double-glycine peptidase domain
LGKHSKFSTLTLEGVNKSFRRGSLSNDPSILLQYSVEKEDYIELFSLSPFVKRLRYFAIAVNFLLLVIVYFAMVFVDVVLLNNEPAIFQVNLMIFSVVLFFISCVYTLLKYKNISKTQAEENYEDRYSGRIFRLEYNKHSREFLVGNRKRRVPANNELEIVKTERKLFVYWRKDKDGEIFLIPTHGDECHMTKVNAIMNDVRSKGKVKIRTAI